MPTADVVYRRKIITSNFISSSNQLNSYEKLYSYFKFVVLIIDNGIVLIFVHPKHFNPDGNPDGIILNSDSYTKCEATTDLIDVFLKIADLN